MKYVADLKINKNKKGPNCQPRRIQTLSMSSWVATIVTVVAVFCCDSKMTFEMLHTLRKPQISGTREYIQLYYRHNKAQ